MQTPCKPISAPVPAAAKAVESLSPVAAAAKAVESLSPVAAAAKAVESLSPVAAAAKAVVSHSLLLLSLLSLSPVAAAAKAVVSRSLLLLLLLLLALPLRAAEPDLRWDVETSRNTPVALEIRRGETLTITPRFLSYGSVLTLTNETVTLAYRDTGLAAGLYYAITGAVHSATGGQVRIRWTTNSCPSATNYTYDIWVGQGTTNILRAYGTIKLLDTIWANATATTNISAWRYIDWANVSNLNTSSSPFLTSAASAITASTATQIVAGILSTNNLNGALVTAGTIGSNALDAATDAAYRAGGSSGISGATATNIVGTVLSTATVAAATWSAVSASASNTSYATVAATATNANYATSAGTSATASNWTGAAAMSNNLLGTVIPTSLVAAASWSAISGVASNLAPGTPSNTLAAAVTNRGVVFAAGANVTLNGGSDPVYATNGATVTIAATLGGGGITSSDFSNLLSDVSLTGTYYNATVLDGVTRANLTNGFDTVASVDSKTNAVYVLATNAAYSAAKPLTNGLDTVASVDAKTNTLRQWTESRVNDATQTIAGASVSGSVPAADNAVSANSANVALAVGDGYDVSIVTPVGAYATSEGSPTGTLARFDRRTLFGNWTNTGDFRVIGALTVLGGGVNTNDASQIDVGTLADARIASTIARDSEIDAATNAIDAAFLAAKNAMTNNNPSFLAVSNAAFNATNIIGGGWYSMDANVTSLLWYSTIYTAKVGKVTAIASVPGSCTGKIWRTLTPTSLVDAVLVTNAISTTTGIVETCSVALGYGNALWLDSGPGATSATNYSVLIEVSTP